MLNHTPMPSSSEPFSGKTWFAAFGPSYSEDLLRLVYNNQALCKKRVRIICSAKCRKDVVSLLNASNFDGEISWMSPLRSFFLGLPSHAHIVIVMPSKLSILGIATYSIRSYNVCCIIHNHPTFKSSYSARVAFIAGLCDRFTLLFSPHICFTAPHVATKWSKWLGMRRAIFNKDPDVLPCLPDYQNVVHSEISTEQRTSSLVSPIIITSWGRPAPYKNLHILDQLFEMAVLHLDKSVCISIRHFGSRPPGYSGQSRSEANVGLNFSFDRPNENQINAIHLESDFIIFPYTDISQSGPIRRAKESNSFIIAPCLDGTFEQLCDYTRKFLFKPGDYKSIVDFLNSVCVSPSSLD